MARAPRRRSKYGNVKTTIDGIVFDSRAEAAYYAELKLREKAGEVRNIERQVRFDLRANGQVICSYFADFTFEECTVPWLDPETYPGITHECEWAARIVDVKGVKTPLYRLKAKWMAALGWPVTEVSRSRR